MKSILTKLTSSEKKLLRNSESNPAKGVLNYNLWKDVSQEQLDMVTNVLNDTPNELYNTFFAMRSKTKTQVHEKAHNVLSQQMHEIELLRHKAKIRKLKFEEHIRNLSINRQKPIILTFFPIGFTIKDFQFHKSEENEKPKKNIRLKKSNCKSPFTHKFSKLLSTSGNS